MLRFMDAGESHGRGIVTIVEGMPHGLPVTAAEIEGELSRRRLGYGRGGRMGLEKDSVEIVSGVRLGISLGSPVAMMVENAEYGSWIEVMDPAGGRRGEPMTRLRPGHADLPGALKYGSRDVRDILERASARQTVGRVCAGALAKKLLYSMNIFVRSHVLRVGDIEVERGTEIPDTRKIERSDEDPMRCLDAEVSARMRNEVDRAREDGDSLGGIFEVIAYSLPAGLGSHVHWDRRLDGKLCAAVMSIQAIKGLEIGDGFALAGCRGSQAADIICHREGKGFHRLRNHAGGLEGGMTNGEPLVIRAAMKPIPTMMSPLTSVDLLTKEKVEAATERADVCAVPAAAVIAESAVAFVLADALLEKLGGDSLAEIRKRYEMTVREQMEF